MRRFEKWRTSWLPPLRAAARFFWSNLADLRDDVNDSWASEPNAASTDEVLDFLFGLQNDPDHPMRVVILSGDIQDGQTVNVDAGDAGLILVPEIEGEIISPAAAA